MSPYVGEIRIFAGNFAPLDWMFCQGQLLPISQHDTLYTLLGTTYGGDGQSTFGLPDLRGRLVAGQGQMPGGSSYPVGQMAGTENVTVNSNQLPAHTHPLAATVGITLDTASQTAPTGNYFALGTPLAYAADLGDSPGSLTDGTVTGQSSVAGTPQPQSHTNIQPVLAINYIISLQGVYPSQP